MRTIAAILSIAISSLAPRSIVAQAGIALPSDPAAWGHTDGVADGGHNLEDQPRRRKDTVAAGVSFQPSIFNPAS